MPQKDICLVVPSIRENCFYDFVKRWHAIGLFDHVDLLLMEDNPKSVIDTSSLSGMGVDCTHLTWTDIDGELGSDKWIVPRRSDTVRSFGYLKAWQFGYPYILTLDDDCYPTTPEDSLEYNGEQFLQEHIKHLTGRSRWFNTLNSVKPRGIPFYNIGKNERTIVNHGLWTNVLDYDAPTQLVRPRPEQFDYENHIVPAGSYFPMCGMNVMWKHDATVLMYHLLMGQWFKDGRKGELYTEGASQLERLPFDRFGDIWCGIFMKKIADICGYQVASGMPYIRHERASNPFTNLKKEANGLEVNEKLWEHVDRFFGQGSHTQHFPRLYSELGVHIGRYDEFPEYVEYFQRLGAAMQTWADMFKEDR